MLFSQLQPRFSDFCEFFWVTTKTLVLVNQITKCNYFSVWKWIICQPQNWESWNCSMFTYVCCWTMHPTDVKNIDYFLWTDQIRIWSLRQISIFRFLFLLITKNSVINTIILKESYCNTFNLQHQILIEKRSILILYFVDFSSGFPIASGRCERVHRSSYTGVSW